MIDFNFVTTKLAVGGAIMTADNMKMIKHVGFTHIINCQIEFDDAKLFTKNYKPIYLYAPTDDDGNAKSVDYFKRILDFALPELIKPNTKMFVHCFAGINRAPSAVYCILRALGYTESEAEDKIVKVRDFVELYYMPDAEQAIKKLGYD